MNQANLADNINVYKIYHHSHEKQDGKKEIDGHFQYHNDKKMDKFPYIVIFYGH